LECCQSYDEQGIATVLALVITPIIRATLKNLISFDVIDLLPSIRLHGPTPRVRHEPVILISFVYDFSYFFGYMW